MAQIYGSGKRQITVKVPCIEQQNSGHDSGVFAIVNMLEFVVNCYHGLRQGLLCFPFIPTDMQKHLVKCFAEKSIQAFPKKKLKVDKQIIIYSVKLDLLCCCSVPGIQGFGPWIVFDVCDKWYLQACEGTDRNKIPKNELYTCRQCQKVK